MEKLGGFNFLNSGQSDKIFDELDFLKEHVLISMNDEELIRISNLEKAIVDKREDEILDNIYNYTKEHVFRHAVLFVSAAHRKSMIKKVEERDMEERVSICWALLAN